MKYSELKKLVYKIDNPNAPFFHVPPADEERDQSLSKS